MNSTNNDVPPGLADLPLDVRMAREVETQREIQEGFTRRHLAEATFAERFLAVHFDRLLRAGPALVTKLRGG